jgi:hypothetical protein
VIDLSGIFLVSSREHGTAVENDEQPQVRRIPDLGIRVLEEMPKLRNNLLAQRNENSGINDDLLLRCDNGGEWHLAVHIVTFVINRSQPKRLLADDFQ